LGLRQNKVMNTAFSSALFEEVRPEFFRVLCGSAARLYVDALDSLERATAEQITGLERNDALAIVEEAVEAHSDLPLDEGGPTILSTRERARSALEVLFQAGWLEEEQRADWQRLVHFNPSGIALMRVLREIAFPAASIFSDKLVSVCTTLARRDPVNDPLLTEPWQHIESCIASLQAGIAELRGMQKAIDRHTRQQLAAETLRENLAVLFDQFVERIGHACYSELVRARLPLRLAEARMRVEEVHRDAALLSKMQSEIMRREPDLTPETAMSRARLRLDELGNLLEAVVPVAEVVDQRTAEFTRRSLARFRYLQETTSQNRARVQEFFESLNRLFMGRRLSSIDDESIEFPRLRIHDSRLLAGLESLYTPRLRRTASEIEPIDQEPSHLQQENAMAQLQAAIRDSLTVARANRFVEKILPQEKTSILSRDIPLDDDEDVADVIACLLNAGTKDARYLVEVAGHSAVSRDEYDAKLTYLIERFTLSRE
jgi:hypothetical protein